MAGLRTRLRIMNSRALTPFFQWMARIPPPENREGVLDYPAPAPGNHSGEAVFLTVATVLLTATVVLPGTAGILSDWLRWPLVLILMFLLPHVAMATVSLASGVLAGSRWHRGVVQDWSCLLGMTVYAACRVAAEGWIGWVCQGWLLFMVLNGLLGLVRHAATKPGPPGG